MTAPQNRLPGVSREAYADHMRDGEFTATCRSASGLIDSPVIMTIFGLSHTLNTKVGNDFVRGVSGGERKRVSIAEA